MQIFRTFYNALEHANLGSENLSKVAIWLQNSIFGFHLSDVATFWGYHFRQDIGEWWCFIMSSIINGYHYRHNVDACNCFQAALLNFVWVCQQVDKGKIGVLIGSGMGGLTVFSDGVQALIEKGYKRITPFFIPYAITNMGSALLAIDLGLMGPNYSISTACATSNYCFYAAANHIRKGEADIMVAGGTEAAIIPVGVGGFIACRALSQRNNAPETASRPWDKDRDGFVMGEGAGVLVSSWKPLFYIHSYLEY